MAGDFSFERGGASGIWLWDGFVEFGGAGLQFERFDVGFLSVDVNTVEVFCFDSGMRQGDRRIDVELLVQLFVAVDIIEDVPDVLVVEIPCFDLDGFALLFDGIGLFGATLYGLCIIDGLIGLLDSQ